jgi:NADH-quinone oxidoreductase subunit J
MMLNIKAKSNKADTWPLLILFLLLSFIFIYQFLISISVNFEQCNDISELNYVWTSWFNKSSTLSNTEIIGNVLYTNYSLVFIISGFILLIAMIGTIVLTMHQKSDKKKQIITIQLLRNSLGVVKFVQLKN